MFGEEDLSGLSAEELERELAAQAAHVDAGVCRLVELVGECQRRLPLILDGGWTFSSWLAYRCSLSPRQARELVRVGERLGERPLIHEAFARGELSFAKTSSLARIEGPVDEPDLLVITGWCTSAGTPFGSTTTAPSTSGTGTGSPSRTWPPSDPGALRDQHDRRGLRIDHDTCRHGYGDRMDLGPTVDALISIAGPQAPAPAEPASP